MGLVTKQTKAERSREGVSPWALIESLSYWFGITCIVTRNNYFSDITIVSNKTQIKAIFGRDAFLDIIIILFWMLGDHKTKLKWKPGGQRSMQSIEGWDMHVVTVNVEYPYVLKKPSELIALDKPCLPTCTLTSCLSLATWIFPEYVQT